MSEGVMCECGIPFSWRVDQGDAHGRQAMLSEALLLLNAFNHVESQPEQGHGDPAGGDAARMTRLEAKVDLVLHLLARALERAPAPAVTRVWLSTEEIAWKEAHPPAPGTALVLDMQASAALPLTLRLPVRALPAAPGQARARLETMSEPLSEAWHQFIFRRHRQAIRDKHLATRS